LRLDQDECDLEFIRSVSGEVIRGLYSDSMENILEAAALAPDYDSIFVLANASQRGGLASGMIAFSSIAPEMPLVATHEFGHSIGGLADEYSCYYCDGSDDERTYTGDESNKPNLTTITDRETTKWADEIDSATELPTTADYPPGVVGLWEGGGYYAYGMYRPQNECHMHCPRLESSHCLPGYC